MALGLASKWHHSAVEVMLIRIATYAYTGTDPVEDDDEHEMPGF